MRLAVVEMMGRVRLPAFADGLRQALQDPDHWVQVAVRDALIHLDESRPHPSA